MSQWLSVINDWFQSRARAEEKAMTTFERIWNDQEAGTPVTFMAVVIGTSEETSAPEIQDIGISIWSKGILSDNMTYHWHVQEKVETIGEDVTNFGNPDSFSFGKIQPITANDVQTVLDDWILSLSGQCEYLCLAMFGKQSMKVLQRQWTSPMPVVVLDLEVLWRLRFEGLIMHSTFEEAFPGLESVVHPIAPVADAGNQAHYLLSVLRLLGKKEGSKGEFSSTLADDI